MNKKYTQAQITEMRKMRREGKALKEIAQAFNCSAATVCKKVQRLRSIKKRESSKDAEPLFKLILDSDLADKTKVELLKRLS